MKWTSEEDAIMREHYPHKTMTEMVALLNRSVSSIRNRVNTLGLKKSAEFMASPAAYRFRRGQTDAQKGTRFQKGHATWNKGMKGWNPEKCKATHFKKGQKPQTWKPIGSERIDEDGVVFVKVSDTGNRRQDWKPVQTLIYERLHGQIPKGHFVIQRDRSKTNFAPENLELVTRAENMRRNTIHNYPPELVSVIRQQDWLKRAIKERESDEQHRHAA
jgi:hypothetical protein